jgi:site-specific DNA recombinase
MKENARQGFVNGIPPFGYETVVAETRGAKVKKKLQIQDGEAETVRVIWDLAARNLTDADPIGVAIADELDHLKLRTRSGRKFSTTDVHKILHNSVYIGRYIFNQRESKTGKKKPPDEWIISDVDPIINKSIFEAVHALMRERDPMRGAERYAANPMLLSKSARHYTCNGSMTLGTGTGNGGHYRYYECSNRRKIPDSCSGCRIGETQLDGLVLEYLSNVLFEPARLQALLKEVIEAEKLADAKIPKELDNLLRRKSDLDGRIGRMYTAIERGIVRDERDFRDRLDDLTGQRALVEIQMACLRQTPARFPSVTADKVDAFAAELRSALHTGEVKERRNYLHLFLSRVVVKEHEIELVGNKRVLAEAYGQDWRAAALSAAARKKSISAVRTQVKGGAPRILGRVAAPHYAAPVPGHDKTAQRTPPPRRFRRRPRVPAGVARLAAIKAGAASLTLGPAYQFDPTVEHR